MVTMAGAAVDIPRVKIHFAWIDTVEISTPVGGDEGGGGGGGGGEGGTCLGGGRGGGGWKEGGLAIGGMEVRVCVCAEWVCRVVGVVWGWGWWR